LKNSAILLLIVIIFSTTCQKPTSQDQNSSISSDIISDNILPFKPENLSPRKMVTLSSGNIRAVFVDNSAYGENHRAGYNGIAELRHKSQDSSVFVPFYAGFNLEHIFGGDSLQQLFEPRIHPMKLYQISENEVLLYQSPTPLSHVESQTVFKLVEPHYIDISFRFIIYEETFFRHGFAGLFWASYINNPSDKKIYFTGIDKNSDSVRWIDAYSKEHGLNSTHTSIHDKNDIYFAPNFNATLASHFSDYNFDQPFYYGRFHNMILAYMFDPAEGIRFSQSPTGGGEFNPAWDFQYLVPDFKTGQIYSFRVRMIYKKFEGSEDVLAEYQHWRE